MAVLTHHYQGKHVRRTFTVRLVAAVRRAPTDVVAAGYAAMTVGCVAIAALAVLAAAQMDAAPGLFAALAVVSALWAALSAYELVQHADTGASADEKRHGQQRDSR